MEHKDPKLRTVNKSVPAFPLNKFPADFAYKIGEQLVYILATRGETDIEGNEWETIFARAIGAEWKQSKVGLDDVVMGNTAWGAKSILHKRPSKATSIRLISGRNDLINSYGYTVQVGHAPDEHGSLVLGIFNERVSSIKEDYKHMRTVVLIRSKSLLECVIYEYKTIRYEPELFYWKWSDKTKNLFGYRKTDHKQMFTWQSGGQQFTIHETVPEERLVINIRKPEMVSKDFVLDKVGFDKSWVTVSLLTAAGPSDTAPDTPTIDII